MRSRKPVVLFAIVFSVYWGLGFHRSPAAKLPQAAAVEAANRPMSARSAVPAPASQPAEDLVLYKGAVEHIFFHPLIAYPERAFRHDSEERGFNDWCITVPEFDS